MRRTLVRNARWLVTMDPERRILTDGAVAIEDDRIVAVGKTAEVVRRFRADKDIDASERLVLPGLGKPECESLHTDFGQAGLDGEVRPFIDDMPAAFARADLIVCRSGAGAVAELAAAGKPAVLVPFPFAADDHQLRNAEAFERAGAAKLVLDRDFTGAKLFELVQALAADRDTLDKMGQCARHFAHPEAARRAAEILEEVAR